MIEVRPIFMEIAYTADSRLSYFEGAPTRHSCIITCGSTEHLENWGCFQELLPSNPVLSPQNAITGNRSCEG